MLQKQNKIAGVEARDLDMDVPIMAANLGTELYSPKDAILVKHMSMSEFRNRLINHWDICWRQGVLKWPGRSGGLSQHRQQEIRDADPDGGDATMA